MTERELEKLQEKARMQEERAKAEYEIARNDPYAARMRAAHENAMERHHSFVQSSPNSHAPSERKASEEYFAKKWEDEQRRKEFEEAEEERYTRRKIAEYEMIGKRDYGLSGEKERAEATKYASDNTLKGVERQALSDMEIAKNKTEAEKYLQEKQLAAQNTMSEREWAARKEIEASRAAAERARGERARDEAIEKETIKGKNRKELEIIKSEGKIETEMIRNPMDGYERKLKDGSIAIFNGKTRRWEKKVD